MKSNSQPELLLKVKKAYQSPTWWYDIRGFFILKLSYNDSLMKQVRFFAENTNGQHLEAAIGTGSLSLMVDLYNRFWRRLPAMTGVGFDYSEDMLQAAHAKFRADRFKIIFGDASNLHFPDESFDTISLANALHCFPEIEKSLVELKRVLRSTGQFYANVILKPDTSTMKGRIAQRICDWGQRKGILYKTYESEEILSLFAKSGFNVERSFRSGNSLNIVASKLNC